MTDDNADEPKRFPWRTLLGVLIIGALVVLLYPQLADFGAELYRFFD